MPNRSKINKSELQTNLAFCHLFIRLLSAKKQTLFLKRHVKLQKSWIQLEQVIKRSNLPWRFCSTGLFWHYFSLDNCQWIHVHLIFTLTIQLALKRLYSQVAVSHPLTILSLHCLPFLFAKHVTLLCRHSQYLVVLQGWSMFSQIIFFYCLENS